MRLNLESPDLLQDPGTQSQQNRVFRINIQRLAFYDKVAILTIQDHPFKTI